MEPSRRPRVVIVSPDLETVDRLQEAVLRAGMEPAPAFSAGEAVGLLRGNLAEGVLLDPGLEEGDALRHWLDRHFRGAVCLVDALDHRLDVPWEGAARPGSPADPDAVEAAGRIERALHRAGRASKA